MPADDLRILARERRLPAGLGPMRYFDEIESTNDEALAWARVGAPQGAVIVADRQKAGRGRHGRSWLSAPGSGLLFSVVLRPDFGAARLGLVSLAAGIAVSRALENTSGLATTLKWPNDVELAGRKVCGILCESVLAGDSVRAVVAGIGINVRTSPDLPPDVAERATSIEDECGRRGIDPPTRSVVLVETLRALSGAIGALTTDPASIVAAAQERSSLIGREVRIDLGAGKSITGVARGLTADGALELETADGPATVRTGEVHKVRERR